MWCHKNHPSKILSEASGQGRHSFRLHARDQQPLDQTTADQAVTKKSEKMAQYGKNEHSLWPIEHGNKAAISRGEKNTHQPTYYRVVQCYSPCFPGKDRPRAESPKNRIRLFRGKLVANKTRKPRYKLPIIHRPLHVMNSCQCEIAISYKSMCATSTSSCSSKTRKYMKIW